MKKVITFFSIIAIIIGVGLIFDYYTKPASVPSPSQDEVSTFLNNLKQETGIDFSGVAEVEFEWQVKKYEEMKSVTVAGKGFEVAGITTEKFREVESFFENNDFEVDVYNVAAGTVSGLTGYIKDRLVCLVAAGATGYKEATGQWIPPEPDKKDVEVKCGQGGDEVISVTSKEEAVKRLLAEKYNKKLAQITLNITQETENYLRGGVAFAPGGPGEEGLFLAAKVDDHWELAFDGIGAISCEQMGKYNFPQEMITDCAETQTIKTKKGDKFSVTLEANPTTGYQWESSFDDSFFQLTDKEYTPLRPELVGSGGIETFNFLALKSGNTEINFSYLRPWEEDTPPIEGRVYKIIIE